MHANTTLHFDITSGIAGDMSLAVLHGLGLNLSEITDIVYKMTDKKVSINVEDTFINGIKSSRLKIDIPHEHAHRKMDDIKALIAKAELPEQVVNDAMGIFSLIADAEGEIHGKSADEVHFHEVGALDSILDIVGFAYGVYRLGIKKITSTTPILGSGFVKCAHGKVPVPAPATLKILEGVEVIRTDEPNELTTPTGAAILKYYVEDFITAYRGKIVASAYSTGTITLNTMPNILRGTLIESAENVDQITIIETNIDDSTGEQVAHTFDALKDVAIDIFCTQTIGKKNRPAIQISVLCENGKLNEVAEALFAHTSTAGVRYRKTDRIVMDRVIKNVKVDGKQVGVKILSYKDIIKHSPEWEDCKKVAEQIGKTPYEVYDRAKAACLK